MDSFLAESGDTVLNYENFVVFDPTSQRIENPDILIRGSEVRTRCQRILETIAGRESLKELILLNRIQRISMMLDLVREDEGVVMTKFLNRVWKRYSYFSNLGENLLDLETFLEIFPEYKANANIFALRIDDEDEDDVEVVPQEKVSVEEVTVPADTDIDE